METNPLKQHPRHSRGVTVILVIIIAVAAVISYAEANHTSTPSSKNANASSRQLASGSSPSTNKTSSAASNKLASTSTIKHIFLIVMENETEGSVIGNSSAPYINSLANQYSLATNYSGVAHPSLPNYLALTSGSIDGTTTDCNPPSAGCIVSVKNLADSLEAKGLSWKQYAESMPSACYTLNYGNDFATKHVPFLYYSDVINNTARCAAHVVPYSVLSSDLSSASTTPNFAFITPNLCNDMHNCGIAAGDAWLKSNIPAILNSAALLSSPILDLYWVNN